MRKLQVTFCVTEGNDPFICEVNGACTIDILTEIERDFIENHSEISPDGLYTLSVTRFNGQYGDYGVCEIAPCWETAVDKFTPPDFSSQQQSTGW